MLDHIIIVLSHTSHPGNIGAAARAMKTMGMTRLVLVNPLNYPCAEATARASGAHDVLAAAQVCESVAEAVSGCRWVIGASARLRRVAMPQMDARQAAIQSRERIRTAPPGQLIAIVFGREKSGLSNEEIGLCHALLNIPSNPEYSSLNLAAAVQLVSYELRMAALTGAADQPRQAAGDANHQPATAGQVHGLAEHLEQVLDEMDYLHSRETRTLRARLRRFWNRAAPSEVEVNIWRGIFSGVSRAIRPDCE